MSVASVLFELLENPGFEENFVVSVAVALEPLVIAGVCVQTVALVDDNSAIKNDPC